MKRYPYPVRLILLAGILSSTAIIVFPKGLFHVMLMGLVIALLASGLVLLYLQKTGRMTWNGPNWGAKLHASPIGRRFLIVIPALCAAAIPMLFLFNRRWGLSDAQVSGACGVLLGISFVMVFKLRSKASLCCDSLQDSQTQQSGTK
jgi:hypothetical protein